MGQVYTIEAQEPTTYVDGGVPITGFLIRARLKKWGELVEVNVPKLDSALIDARIQALIVEREALDKLGG